MIFSILGIEKFGSFWNMESAWPSATRSPRRPRGETQRLQVIPHVSLVLPDGAGRDVRRQQAYALRSREVPELLQAHMDVRDVVPQGGLVQPEVVEVEEAVRVTAEA